jgi:hypothetical protein
MGSDSRRSAVPKAVRGEGKMNPANFFAELKRRNVYKLAIAYANVAWLLAKIGNY